MSALTLSGRAPRPRRAAASPRPQRRTSYPDLSLRVKPPLLEPASSWKPWTDRRTYATSVHAELWPSWTDPVVFATSGDQQGEV